MAADTGDRLQATLAVFACADGSMLFVRAACAPPPEAGHAHGPLAFHGQVDVDARSAAWRLLLQQIDRHLFATVGPAEAALLMESGAALPGPASARSDAAG
jgi:hypothetical protein